MTQVIFGFPRPLLGSLRRVMAKIQIKPLRSRPGGDGYRVLALPYWPKGLRRDAVDFWAKGLAPDRELLKRRGRGLPPVAYACIYRSQLRRPCSINRLKPLALLSLRRRLTLVCACPRPEYCHDRFLAEAMERCRKARDFKMSPVDCCRATREPRRRRG